MTEIKPEFLDGEIDSRWYINLRTPKLKMTEQEHIECEIQEYEIELQQHKEAIERFKVRIEKKRKELQELKFNQSPKKTLRKIIDEWINDEENATCEELINRIANWLPNEYVSYSEYNKGWNQCLHTIKTNLRPSQKLYSKNLPYFVGN